MSDPHQTAWSDYWRRGEPGRSGCIPARATPLEQAQRQVWVEAADKLPRGASVLDLAAGDGAVLRHLRARRTDLKLIGVDSATELPRSPAGIILKAGTRMERLPFPDRRFDLVTSQFGIEYGNVEKIAAEIARVLRPGGRVLFLVHYAAGPVVSHNRDRAVALRWALECETFWDRARSFAHSRTLGPLPAPPYFADMVREASMRFPRQPAAAEVREAVRRALVSGGHSPPAQTIALINDLQNMARNECSRIDALLAAAKDMEGATALAAMLANAGLAMTEPEMVNEYPAGPPFALLIRGRRRGSVES